MDFRRKGMAKLGDKSRDPGWRKCGQLRSDKFCSICMAFFRKGEEYGVIRRDRHMVRFGHRECAERQANEQPRQG